jgi:hypothetical protein
MSTFKEQQREWYNTANAHPDKIKWRTFHQTEDERGVYEEALNHYTPSDCEMREIMEIEADLKKRDKGTNTDHYEMQVERENLLDGLSDDSFETEAEFNRALARFRTAYYRLMKEER